jgi:hypothetical protein
MKKISILLTLLIALTFSGASVADCNCEYRCKVSYIQKTSLNESKKQVIDTQFENEHYCTEGVDKLSKKIMHWLSENSSREVVGMGGAVKCKSRATWTWHVYHKCKPKYKKELIKELKKAYPNRVHIDDTN